MYIVFNKHTLCIQVGGGGGLDYERRRLEALVDARRSQLSSSGLPPFANRAPSDYALSELLPRTYHWLVAAHLALAERITGEEIAPPSASASAASSSSSAGEAAAAAEGKRPALAGMEELRRVRAAVAIGECRTRELNP
jgi:hypothetical protein